MMMCTSVFFPFSPTNLPLAWLALTAFNLRGWWVVKDRHSARARPFAEFIHRCIMSPSLSLVSLEKDRLDLGSPLWEVLHSYEEIACESVERLAGLKRRGEDSFNRVACFNLCSAPWRSFLISSFEESSWSVSSWCSTFCDVACQLRF